MISISPELANKLLGFQYENLGYGKFRCRSCGSLKIVDYGDHEQPTTEEREPGSKNCPFEQLRLAIENYDPNEPEKII